MLVLDSRLSEGSTLSESKTGKKVPNREVRNRAAPPAISGVMRLPSMTCVLLGALEGSEDGEDGVVAVVVELKASLIVENISVADVVLGGLVVDFTGCQVEEDGGGLE